MQLTDVAGPEAVVERQLRAYNRRDLDAFAACYADEIELWNPDGSLLCSGIAGLRTVYGRLFEANPDLLATVVARIVGNSVVVDREYVSGRREQEPFYAYAVFEVSAGRIRRGWFHRDDALT
jgi:hypothetical protein